MAKLKNIRNIAFNDNTNLTGDWCEYIRDLHVASGSANGDVTVSWIGSMSGVKFNGQRVYNTSAHLIWSEESGLITLQYNDTYEPLTAPLVV